LLATASGGQTPPAGYRVRVTLPLTPGPDRMRGRLELLEDARIEPNMRTAIAGAFGNEPCDDRPPAALHLLCEAPGHLPLRAALLRLLDAQGHVIATQTSERPLAALSTMRLYASNRRTYFFTVDLTAEMGSYSGPYTRLAEPESAGFGWLTADSVGVATARVSLISTPKTAWRAMPRADGRGRDLLMVLCRPDFDAGPNEKEPFTLTYMRYTFDGARWKIRERHERGCYESDEDFPTTSKFP
jgi:hypothetical protein